MNKTIDILLYVDRLDAYRVDNLEKQVIKAITNSFGKAIWNRALVVLTHAQFSPPDGVPYEEFFSRRSEALLKTVRFGASFNKKDTQVAFAIFVHHCEQILSFIMFSVHFFIVCLYVYVNIFSVDNTHVITCEHISCPCFLSFFSQ